MSAERLPMELVQLLTPLPRVRSGPTPISRVHEAQFDRAVFVKLTAEGTGIVDITQIVRVIAEGKNCCDVELNFRIFGPETVIIFFPSREVRESYVNPNKSIEVGGVVCFLTRWTSTYNAWAYCSEVKVWLKINNLLLHHYTEDRAALVSQFGSLVRANMEKVRYDMSSLEVLLSCSDVNDIPRTMLYFYDGGFCTFLTFKAVLTLDAGIFSAMGLCDPVLTYMEVERRARDALMVAVVVQAEPASNYVSGDRVF